MGDPYVYSPIVLSWDVLLFVVYGLDWIPIDHCTNIHCNGSTL
ncbi:MAG: hypothetical protein ACM3VV_03320 [Deltaproteobacteria bacterium]